MARTTWDVWVVLANDPDQLIAYVPRWKSIQFADQLNDTGSATVEHDFSDPFFAAFQSEYGDSLLEGPYALQIRRDGFPVFTFFIEDVQVDRAGFSQPLVIGGRGIAAALEWGIVLPEDFTNQARATAGTTQRPRFFDRLFPGYSYNVRVATTANISATYAPGPQVDVAGAGARLTATSNGSINNSGIDGVTDLVVGDTALVKSQTNAAHNGIYWIVSVGGASTPFVLQRTARADGSPLSDLEVDNAAFVEEGTVNGYTSFKISSNGGLSNSNQVGTVDILWDAVTLGSFTGISAFYILFLEADTGFEYSTKKSDFGTIKTLNGRGGVGFAVDWPLYLDTQLELSNGKTDSNGRVVKDGGNFNIAVGRTLLEVLNEVASNTGVDWHVSPSGSVSIAVRPFVTDTVVFDEPFGDNLTSGSAALLFTLPMLEQVETRTSVAELRTVVYGSDGFNLDRQISERTGTFGFREMFIENTSDDAPAVANITSAAARQVKDGKLQITATFIEKEGITAWTDFDIGDKVLVEIDVGVYGERIISAIGASIDEAGNETIEVTFGDIFQDMATNLKYAANYGRLSAAEIPAFTLRGTSSQPQAPTGTSVGAEVTGMSNRVIVNWESPDNSSATQYEAIVYREEQSSASATFGIQITYVIDDIFRDGNRAFVELDENHNYSVGDYVNIYDTTNGVFDRTMIFLTSASGQSFTFDDVGPDIPTGTFSAGEVARVVERHSTMVPSNKTSAAFENLAAPGRQYEFVILPYASNGRAGVPSAPFTFTAATDAQILLNGAIRSNNYVTNTSGWTIEATGDAELNSVTIRNGAFVQGTMTAATIQTGTTNPRVIVDSAGLRAFNNAGDIVTSVSASTGALFSSSATISGNITANSLSANATITSPVITGGSINGATLDIGGNDATSFHVDASGNMFLGAATFATAPFKVSSTGALTATNATISGVVQDGGAADDINNNSTTIAGGKITANTITATEISSAFIYAGTISADQINAGSLSADLISGGTISGVDMVLEDNGVRTTVNVPFFFNDNFFTLVVSNISSPLHSTRIGPGHVIISTPDAGIGLDANEFFAISTGEGILGSHIQGDTIAGAKGTGVTISASGTGYFSNVGNLPREFFGIGLAYTNGSPGAGFYIIANNDPGTTSLVHVSTFSDRRFKSNIEYVSAEENNKIYSLMPRQYILGDNYPSPTLRGEKRVGLIADEVESVFPEAVLFERIERHIVHDWIVNGFSLTQEQMELYGDAPDKYEFTEDGVYRYPEYQHVNYAALVPRLIGTIVDLNNRLTLLESQS